MQDDLLAELEKMEPEGLDEQLLGVETAPTTSLGIEDLPEVRK